MHVTQMIKICKEEFDRLMETSPNIPDKIITRFKLTFNTNNFKQLNPDPNSPNPKIFTPEICDTLVSTELSRNPWASEENRNKKLNQINNKEKQNIEKILNFNKIFYDINKREPLDSEIIDNLKEQIDLSTLIICLEQIKKNKDINNNINDDINKDINKNTNNSTKINTFNTEEGVNQTL